MAKRGRPSKAATPPKPEVEEDLVVVLPTESAFRATVMKLAGARKRKRASMEEIAGATKDAVSKSIHKGALGFHQRIDEMDPIKRSEFLFHWDQYRSWSDWDDHMDLFRERKEEAADKRPRARANNATAPAPEAA